MLTPEEKAWREENASYRKEAIEPGLEGTRAWARTSQVSYAAVWTHLASAAGLGGGLGKDDLVGAILYYHYSVRSHKSPEKLDRDYEWIKEGQYIIYRFICLLTMPYSMAGSNQ